VTATIHAIGCSIGSAVSMEELEGNEVEKEILAFFRKDGFSHFTRNDLDLADMATEAIFNSLADTSVTAKDIDALVFCTESFWNTELVILEGKNIAQHSRLREGLLQAIFLRSGLVNAYPYANWMSACANFVSTLSLATGLLETGQHRNVIVIMADRLAPKASRIMPNGASILSDMAVCFLVGHSLQGYKIRHIVTHVATAVFAAQERGDPQARVLEMLQSLQEFGTKIKAKTGRTLGEFDSIFVDCLNSNFLGVVCAGLKIKPNSLSSPLKARFAHAFSMDSLLALFHLEATKQLSSGETLAFLNVGPWAFGLVVLEVV